MYYNEDEARRLVIEAGHRLLENRLIARTWGNISARISRDEFVITPSGKAYDALREHDPVVVRIDDCSYRGNVKPSSEKGVHAAAYSLRDDAAFVIHTHQYYASCVAADCRSVSFAPCAEYALPGTGRLKKALEECMAGNPQNNEFLMARHGALITGHDFEDAFERAGELEKKCRELVEERVRPGSFAEPAAFDAERIHIGALPFVKVAADPYILECCSRGGRVGAYIDDFAQIVGPDIQVVENDPEAAQRALLGYSPASAPAMPSKIPMTGVLNRMGGQHESLNSVIGRNAVLVKGVGAVCAGKSESDADAIAMIVSKNCAAACYAVQAKPLGLIDSNLQRYIYLTKYSKLMKEQ